MTPDRIVAFALAWALIAVLLLLLIWVHRRRPFTVGEVSVLVLASVLTGLVGGLTSLHGLGIIDPMTEGVRLAVIVLRGVATALYLGVLLNVLGWPPPVLCRWLR